MISRSTLFFITTLLAFQSIISGAPRREKENISVEEARIHFFNQMVPGYIQGKVQKIISGANSHAKKKVPNEDNLNDHKLEVGYWYKPDDFDAEFNIIDIGIFDMPAPPAGSRRTDNYVNYYLTFRNEKNNDIIMPVTNYNSAEMLLHAGAVQELVTRMIQTKQYNKELDLYFKTIYDIKIEIVRLAEDYRYTLDEEVTNEGVNLILKSHDNVVAHINLSIEKYTHSKDKETHRIVAEIRVSTINKFDAKDVNDYHLIRLPMFSHKKNEFANSFEPIKTLLAPNEYINDLQDVSTYIKEYLVQHDPKMVIKSAGTHDSDKQSLKITFNSQEAEFHVSYRLPSPVDVGVFDIEFIHEDNIKKVEMRRMKRRDFVKFLTTHFHSSLLSIFEQIREMFLNAAKTEHDVDGHKFTTSTPRSYLSFMSSGTDMNKVVSYKDVKDKSLELKYQETGKKAEFQIIKNIAGHEEQFKYEFSKNKYDRKFTAKYITFVMSRGDGVYESKSTKVDESGSEDHYDKYGINYNNQDSFHVSEQNHHDTQINHSYDHNGQYINHNQNEYEQAPGDTSSEYWDGNTNEQNTEEDIYTPSYTSSFDQRSPSHSSHHYLLV